MQIFPTKMCNVTAWRHSILRAHWLMALVAGSWKGYSPGIAASPISHWLLGSTGRVCRRSLTEWKILFTGRQTCSLYLVLWLCGRYLNVPFILFLICSHFAAVSRAGCWSGARLVHPVLPLIPFLFDDHLPYPGGGDGNGGTFMWVVADGGVCPHVANTAGGYREGRIKNFFYVFVSWSLQIVLDWSHVILFARPKQSPEFSSLCFLPGMK